MKKNSAIVAAIVLVGIGALLLSNQNCQGACRKIGKTLFKDGLQGLFA